MGRAAGTGRPHFFKCSQERKERYAPWEYRPGPVHTVTRTGRLKTTGHGPIPEVPRPSDGWHRKLPYAIEYTCSCGHTGWTTHPDIFRRPVKES